MTERETTTAMTTDRSRIGPLVLSFALVLLAGCGERDDKAEGPPAGEWSVTAWGRLFEVFPEVEPLVAGESATAHTHVTRLSDFSPLVDGTVTIVLHGRSGEKVFSADEPVRPGIYTILLAPDSPGEYDLSFRITTSGETEEIRGGRVRVGTAESPGTIIRAPAPRGATDGGEPIDFLKEQQWRSDFGTDWVRSGRLALSTSGLARVRPPAGGETTITAPFDGVVRPAGAWPYPGYPVAAGRPLFQVVPRVAAERSLASLDAEAAGIANELQTARARLTRLEELFELDAVSRRELEEARARVQTLEARQRAARDDLASARSSRSGGAAGAITISAPFRGEIARVVATPGSTVAAGQELARLVRTDVMWLEIALPPSGARDLSEAGIAGVVLVDRQHPPIRIDQGLRLISVAPEISRETGTITALVEISAATGLALGATVEAHVLTPHEQEGIVIPATAVIDDGGVPIVYLQLSGESFVRQEISVLSLQGDLILVDHLVPGQRMVTRGGDAIRRVSLMSSGEAHGHVH
jgi:membrane fusion protein, heavy metal efflux system